MERTLSKRLRDSGVGKMDRRQLLRALGLGAGAAFVGGGVARSAPSAAPAGPIQSVTPATYDQGFQAVAYNHISYAVPDYAEMRDFFVELYGMKVVWDDATTCSVEFGDPPNAIYITPLRPGQKEEVLGSDWAGRSGRGFVSHVAFSIENFDLAAVEAELKRRGFDPHYDGQYAWTIVDPTSGYRVQICDIRGVFPGAARPDADESVGLANLDKVPQTDGSPFKAYAVSHFVLNVPDVAKTRDFYTDLLGMDVIYYKPGDVAGVDHTGGPVCFLRFGQNTFYLRKSRHPENKAYVSHFSPLVENFDQEAVRAELVRRGYEPRPDSKFAWTIADPAGMRIEVAGWGLPEHIGGDCNGGIGGCPGGRDS